jgi:hypothetical protein
MNSLKMQGCHLIFTSIFLHRDPPIFLNLNSPHMQTCQLSFTIIFLHRLAKNISILFPSPTSPPHSTWHYPAQLSPCPRWAKVDHNRFLYPALSYMFTGPVPTFGLQRCSLIGLVFCRVRPWACIFQGCTPCPGKAAHTTRRPATRWWGCLLLQFLTRRWGHGARLVTRPRCPPCSPCSSRW